MFDFLGVTDSIIPSEMKQWYAIPLYNLLTRPQTKNLTENRGNHGKQSIRTPTAVGGRVRSADFVRKCILYIQDSDPCTVSLDAISHDFSYNKVYFTTLFRKHFGISFTDFLNHYKIDNARAIIRSGNRNLSEVARLSGFNYYAYFFRKFKEVCGITPSEYADFCDSREKK